MSGKRLVFTITYLLLTGMGIAYSQQNRTLYHMHYVPESSLLNPAVPMPCGWFIGLPVISSVHANVGNNIASFNQLVQSQGNGRYLLDIYEGEKYLHRRNYVTAETHLQWLAIGYRKLNWSFLFTIQEKINGYGTISKDLAKLILHGNSQFVGEIVDFKGNGVTMNHYREYALSLAHESDDGFSWGIRGKLLFGKLNVSTRENSIGLYTKDPTYNLSFSGSSQIHTSLPVYYPINNNRPVERITDETSLSEIMMNKSNPGLALDLGLIRPLSVNTLFSASLLDIGFIRWTSNVHNYLAGGTFLYDGPINNNIDTPAYIEELGNALADSLQLTSNTNPYTTFLAPHLLSGLSHQFNNRVKLSAMGDILWQRTKLSSGLNLSGDFEPVQNLHVLLSYTLQYNSFNHLGAGIVVGKNPVQFYVVSDNASAFFWPYSARNVNIRFGLNILPGCARKEYDWRNKRPQIRSLEGKCGWENPIPRSKRKHRP